MFVPLSASMTDKRAYASASPLPDGTVLIAGGEDGANNLNTAEIYDPTTQTFTALANTMTKARVGATAGLLPPTVSDPDGHVIIAGGDGLAGGDLYDPVTQTFAAGNEGPAQPRTSGAGAVIDGGNEMLIAGGITEFYFEDTGELYNRANDTYFALGATLSSERYLLPAAAPLPGGGVLVVGGLSALNDFPMISADIYDPTTESFTEATGRMSVAREAPLAAPLPDGRVLVAGGFNGDTVNRSAEIYDPTTQTFTPVGTLPDQQMSIPRYAAVAAPLPDGTVLIAGGQTSYSGDIRASAELFVPAGEPFAAGSGDFPSEPVGQRSPAQSFVVTNLGAQRLTMGSSVITGTGGFAIANDGCAAQPPLAFRASCTITVTFSPSGSGACSGSLALANDGVGGTQTIALTGTGTGGSLLCNQPPPTPTTPLTPITPISSTPPNHTSSPPIPKLDVVSCRTLTRRTRSHGRSIRVKFNSCTVKLEDGSVHVTARSTRATLSRGATTYATGVASAGPARLLLVPRHPLRPGSYRLTLRQPVKRGIRTTRLAVTLA
jgi:hypothetical protein